jgi:hypothetical protein
MPYLVCEDCGGYYVLEKWDEPDDFESCQCGGNLKYVKSIDSELDKLSEIPDILISRTFKVILLLTAVIITIYFLMI